MAAQQSDVTLAPGTIEDEGYYRRYLPLWSTPGRLSMGRHPAIEPGDRWKNPTQYALYVKLIRLSLEQKYC